MNKKFIFTLFFSYIFSQSSIDTLSVTIYPEYYYQGIMVEYRFDKYSNEKHTFNLSVIGLIITSISFLMIGDVETEIKIGTDCNGKKEKVAVLFTQRNEIKIINLSEVQDSIKVQDNNGLFEIIDIDDNYIDIEKITFPEEMFNDGETQAIKLIIIE